MNINTDVSLIPQTAYEAALLLGIAICIGLLIWALIPKRTDVSEQWVDRK